jgi:hypothetical protein
MNLGVTDRLRPILDAVRRFIDERVIPVEDEYLAEVANGDRWSLNERQAEIMLGLKSAAREPNMPTSPRRPAAPSSPPRPSTAALRIPATWKSWNATAPRSRKRPGSSRCSTAKFARHTR